MNTRCTAGETQEAIEEYTRRSPGLIEAFSTTSFEALTVIVNVIDTAQGLVCFFFWRLYKSPNTAKTWNSATAYV